MNADLRERIRQAIDAQARARTNEAPFIHRCARCGCPREDRTIGCGTCSNRHRLRAKRAAKRTPLPV